VSDEPAEIIARPPSSPIAAIMLFVCIVGTSLAISVIWWELFTEYQPGTGPGSPPQDPEMKKHPVRDNALNHVIDHYAVDFPGNKETLIAVQEELGVGEKIGDLEASSGTAAPPSDGGGGESPPPPEKPEGGEGE
jgi:hypothetical protein